MTTESIDALDQFERDAVYLDSHRSEWCEQYPDHWVVVYGGAIVCAAPDLDEALDEAGRQGDIAYMVVERMSTEPIGMIL